MPTISSCRRDSTNKIFQESIKGGYLDFSHLTELKNVYITEIYMKKQYKSSKIKNKKITFFLMRVPLTLYHTNPTFKDPREEGFGNYGGKRRKCW